MTFRVPVGYNPAELPGQIVDEGAMGRIVDPITGASLFNPNSDPNEVGIDPLTGEEFVAGTDTGFGAVAWDGLFSGLYNGTFAAGPPDGANSQIEEQYNEVPYWRYVQDDSGHIRAKWVAIAGPDIGPSGNSIQWTATDVVAGDEAYFEQIVLISSRDHVRAPVYLVGGASASTSNLKSTCAYQPLDTNGLETGTAWTSEALSFSSYSGPVSGIVGIPDDARYLRVRFGVKATGSYAGPVTRTIREVWNGRPRTIDITLSGSDIELPASSTRAFYPDGGNSNGHPDQAALRLLCPGYGWVSSVSAVLNDTLYGGDISVSVYNVTQADDSGTAAPIPLGSDSGYAASVYDATSNVLVPGDYLRFRTRVTDGTVTTTGRDLHVIACCTFVIPGASTG